MLMEYLRNVLPPRAACTLVMPGVQVCRFSLTLPRGGQPHPLAPELPPLQFETLFCQEGRLLLERTGGRLLTVEKGEVLLLSDSSSVLGGKLGEALGGILVRVDARAAKESFFALCKLLGFQVDTGEVKRRMAGREGCAVLPQMPWTQAVFEQLEGLSEAERERYSVWKAVELLYLLGSGSELLGLESACPAGGYPARMMEQVRLYMETHLEEKLTIPALSRRFALSQTALKVQFQRRYGSSVHRCLRELRMRRAGELLRTTGMTVQQVAQAVGYDGVSQFSVAFKTCYGVTPGQYAKMSETVKT